MRQLSTLLLSLLLCATCLAQPDSRPGPYQATLAKINALLVGGAATVKEIEFTTDGSALASSSKTQVYSNGNAGSLFANVPSARYFGLLVDGFTSYTFGYSANLATTGANVFQIGDGSGSYIQSDGFGLLHRVSNTYAHTFKVNTTDVGYFDGSGLTVTKNIVSSNNSNTGDRTTNLDVQRYFNNIFWGWPNSAYTCSVGSFNGSGYPFICFYGYHSATTNTIKRSSASNQPVWLQSLGGYLSIWQGSSGTADTDCTSTEKYRFAAALAEFDRLSLGGTIGSSVDPGAGGLALTGKFYISTTQTPASAGAAGTVGQVCWDSSYIYICTATNTWKRAAIATW